MGIFLALKQLEKACASTVPLQRDNVKFVPIDARGAHTPLEEAALSRDRCFDIGTFSLPEDDGEAGGNTDTLRSRVGVLIRIGYSAPERGDRILFDALLSEDVRRIQATMMLPTSWDQSATGIISVFKESPPVSEKADNGALLTLLPWIMLFREESP